MTVRGRKKGNKVRKGRQKGMARKELSHVFCYCSWKPCPTFLWTIIKHMVSWVFQTSVPMFFLSFPLFFPPFIIQFPSLLPSSSSLTVISLDLGWLGVSQWWTLVFTTLLTDFGVSECWSLVFGPLLPIAHAQPVPFGAKGNTFVISLSC